jgi:hypothetical protein
MNIYSKKNTPDGFYVYAYIRKSDSTPYYIGKGYGSRAWDKHHFRIPNNPVQIIIIESNLSEIGAFAIERRMIRWYGRQDNNTGILRNKTDGGDGCHGFVMSTEQKQKISASTKGVPRGKLTPEQLAKRKKRRPPSAETIEKMRLAQQNKKPMSEEAKMKISAALKGRPISNEHKLNISKAKKGKLLTEEQKEYQRANHKN